MYHEPYIKQMVETMQERQALAAKNPDIGFMYKDFKESVEGAAKALKNVPMKQNDILDFLSYYRHAGVTQGHLAVLSRKHLVENEAQSFNAALQSDIDDLARGLASLVDRLDQRGRGV